MIGQVLRSTASNSFKLVVATIITFVMTPIYLRELGDYDYGIWEVIVSVIGYLGLIDLGLRPTISRYTAYYFRKADREGKDVHTVYSTSLILMATAGVIAAGATFVWSISAPQVLSPEPGQDARYALVLQLIALQLLFAFPFYSMESTLEGRLWYTTKNNIAIAASIIMSTFLYFALPHYDALVLLATATLVMTLSKLVIFALVLRSRRYGGHRFSLTNFSIPLTKEMLVFGYKSLVQGLAAKIQSKADPVIIAFAMGPQFIVFYSLPHALVSRATSISAVLTHALMPAFSQMHSNDDQKGIERYFMFGSKFVAAIHIASCTGMALLGEAFIRLWISEHYATEARYILYIMAASTLMQGALPLHNRMLMAMNKHGPLSWLYVSRAIINVILTLVLVFPFGLVGVAFATLLSNIIVLPFIWRLVFSNIEATSEHYLRRTLAPLLISSAVMAGAVSLVLQWNPVQGWLDLGTLVFLGISVYAVTLWLVGLNTEERSTYLALVRRGRTGK